MAFSALQSQRSLMDVVVAGHTGRFQPEVSVLGVFATGHLENIGFLELGFMAVFTFAFGMPSLQRPAGTAVIEPLRGALFKMDQGEISPPMLQVAAGALLVRNPAVKPPALQSEEGDRLVAIHAPVVHRLIAAVAFEAFERCVQVFVNT